MNWKTYALEIVAILALCAAVLFGGYRWGAAVTQRDAALAPRDTTVKWKVDTIKVNKIRVDTLRTTDTIVVHQGQPPGVAWYQAIGDTVIDGIDLRVAYNSPLPLSAQGFFSDILICIPPRIDSVRTVTITKTVTIVEEKINWWIPVAGVAVGAATAAILIKAN